MNDNRLILMLGSVTNFSVSVANVQVTQRTLRLY